MPAPPEPVKLGAPGPIADCQPCWLEQGGATLTLRFHIESASSGERLVRAIEVARLQKGSGSQVLEVDDMMPAAAGEQFFAGTVDLNFDGHPDFMLLTSRGVANAAAQYWLYSPSAGRFRPLGSYPILQADPERRTLTSYQRLGFGGMAYEKNEYVVHEGELQVIRSETQDATGKAGVYRRVVRERKDGGLTETVNRLIRGKTAAAP